MELEDQRKLSYYIDLVWSYYFNEDSNMPCQNIEDYLNYYVKPEYRNIFEEKERFEPQWLKLVEEISGAEWVRGHARDMSHNLNNGFYAIIHLKDRKSELLGMTLAISLIGKQFGFYYSDYQMRGKIAQPIYEPTKRYVSRISWPQFPRCNPDTSYFPFNVKQKKYYPIVKSMVQAHFPDFTEFDNRFANYQINEIQTDQSFFDSMDLFQAFFGNGITGVI